jgi:hypothetical protein
VNSSEAGERKKTFLTEHTENTEKTYFFIAVDPASVGTFGDAGNEERFWRYYAPRPKA